MTTHQYYLVRWTWTNPAWDEVDGTTRRYHATSKTDANAMARREAKDGGHNGVTFSATLDADQSEPFYDLDD